MSDEPEAVTQREADARIREIGRKLDQVIEKLEDPSASPIGRILSDRADRNERRIDGLDARTDALERDRDKQAGAMAFIRGVQIVLAIVTGAVALFVALRGGVG